MNFSHLFQIGIETNIMAGIAAGIFNQIILVILLRRPKLRGFGNLRDDRIFPSFRIINYFNHFLRNFFLFIVLIKNRRTVRSANVIPLLIHSSRIMDAKKEIQNFFVSNFRWIKFNLQRLGVARMVFISWMIVLASDIS